MKVGKIPQQEGSFRQTFRSGETAFEVVHDRSRACYCIRLRLSPERFQQHTHRAHAISITVVQRKRQDDIVAIFAVISLVRR